MARTGTLPAPASTPTAGATLPTHTTTIPAVSMSTLTLLRHRLQLLISSRCFMLSQPLPHIIPPSHNSSLTTVTCPLKLPICSFSSPLPIKVPTPPLSFSNIDQRLSHNRQPQILISCPISAPFHGLTPTTRRVRHSICGLPCHMQELSHRRRQ